MIGELNHLWQSTIFAVVAGFLTIAFRRNRAQVRYWLWFSASFKFFVPFSLLIALGSYVPWARATHNIATQIATPAASLAMEEFTELFPDTSSLVQPAQGAIHWIPIAIFSVWACGFLGVAMIRFRGWLRIRAAVRASRPIEVCASAGKAERGSPNLTDGAGRLTARATPGLLEPGVVGILRPILLLLAGIEDRLTAAQLDAVVAHELCHVERRDNLFAAIHMLVEAIFWFHPLVWWIGAKLVEERERACDEAVLSLGSEPHVYAEAIVNVCKLYVESPLVCVAGVTGANLKKRIEEIMSNRIGTRLSYGKKIALAAVGAATLTAPMVVGIVNPSAVRGQSPAVPLTFEVASVKPHKPEAGPLRVSTSVEVGRINFANVTVKNCIRQAYHLKPYQVSGGPSWVSDDRYDVIAKAAGTASRNQVMLMLQALLAERFKLTFHFEEKEMPIYSLVIAKNGPKIKEAKDDGNGVEIGGDAQHPLTARNISMAQFAGTLSRLQELDRPVVDWTGLKGVFNITLDFVAEDAASPDSAGPSILTALPEQLGLKLEATKGPVQILVIDHVERPSDNFEPPPAKPEAAVAPVRSPVAAKPQSRPAQVAETPLRFDAASIKPSSQNLGGGRGGGGVAGGRPFPIAGGILRYTPGMVTSRSVSARRIILEAYHLTAYQLSGGPGWLDSDSFALEAKSESSTNENQLRLMLRTMLSDRFNLVLHRETKEIPVYTLTVGKTGLKLPDLKEREPQPTTMQRRVEAPTGRMMDRGTIQYFADWLNLTDRLGRPVVDRTGLQGTYLLFFEWDEESFLAEIQEQSGLKFESQKAPMDVLVIDRVEKPSEN